MFTEVETTSSNKQTLRKPLPDSLTLLVTRCSLYFEQ